jgi:hypothetical protein
MVVGKNLQLPVAPVVNPRLAPGSTFRVVSKDPSRLLVAGPTGPPDASATVDAGFPRITLYAQAGGGADAELEFSGPGLATSTESVRLVDSLVQLSTDRGVSLRTVTLAFSSRNTLTPLRANAVADVSGPSGSAFVPQLVRATGLDELLLEVADPAVARVPPLGTLGTPFSVTALRAGTTALTIRSATGTFPTTTVPLVVPPPALELEQLEIRQRMVREHVVRMAGDDDPLLTVATRDAGVAMLSLSAGGTAEREIQVRANTPFWVHGRGTGDAVLVATAPGGRRVESVVSTRPLAVALAVPLGSTSWTSLSFLGFALPPSGARTPVVAMVVAPDFGPDVRWDLAASTSPIRVKLESSNALFTAEGEFEFRPGRLLDRVVVRTQAVEGFGQAELKPDQADVLGNSYPFRIAVPVPTIRRVELGKNQTKALELSMGFNMPYFVGEFTATSSDPSRLLLATSPCSEPAATVRGTYDLTAPTLYAVGIEAGGIPTVTVEIAGGRAIWFGSVYASGFGNRSGLLAGPAGRDLSVPLELMLPNEIPFATAYYRFGAPPVRIALESSNPDVVEPGSVTMNPCDRVATASLRALRPGRATLTVVQPEGFQPHIRGGSIAVVVQ